MKLQHKRYLQRLAAACLAGTMALSMISCGGGQQGDKNLITSQAESQAAETVQTAETQARRTLAQAQADAQAVLRQAEEQIRQTVEQYGQLHQSFEAALGRITGELRGMDAAAAQLPERFNSLKAGLEELLEQAKEQ